MLSMGCPNIVWISLESVRYDHTSLAGYDRDTTPELSKIADHPAAKSFEFGFSNGIWTRAAVSTVLTGTYPSRHGVGVQDTNSVVPEELLTVPELLDKANYKTACLTPNPHISSNSGLDRGFDKFCYFRRGHLMDAASPTSLLKFVLQLRRHSAGYTTNGIEHSIDYLIHQEAKRLISNLSDSEDSYFIYIHQGDTHRPYSPPLPYRDEFTGDIDMSASEAYEFSHHSQDHLFEHLAGGSDYTQREWEGLVAMYDAGIKYADKLVGKLIKYVQSQCDNTIIVITGDHGELFGERDLMEHRITTHDAVSRVPLIVYGSKAVAESETELVQHVDIVRTLLEEEVGIQPAQLQGHNLSETTPEFAIIQRGGHRYRKTLDKMNKYEMKIDTTPFHNATLHTARTEDFKLLLSEDRTELFELPREDADVSDRYPDVTEHLSQKLKVFLNGPGEPITTDRSKGKIDDDIRDHLSELGYLTKE